MNSEHTIPRVGGQFKEHLVAVELYDQTMLRREQAEAGGGRAAKRAGPLASDSVSSAQQRILSGWQSGIPVRDVRRLTVPPEVLALVPESIVWDLKALPLALEDGTLLVATETPDDASLLELLSLVTNRRIQPVLPLRGGLHEALEANYPRPSRQPLPGPFYEDTRIASLQKSGGSPPTGDSATEVFASNGASQQHAAAQVGEQLETDRADSRQKELVALGKLRKDKLVHPTPQSEETAIPSMHRAGKRVLVREEPAALADSPGKTGPQFWLWAAGLLLFGFGDTLTSFLVFGSGGRETNILLGLVLALFGRSVWVFIGTKLVAMVGLLLLSRWQPRIETITSWAMVASGLFLVGQNSTILLLGR